MIDPISAYTPLLQAAPTRSADPEEAGKQFETLFVQQILSHMPIAGMGKEGEQWVGMFREQLARELVDGGGFGLADAIARQLGAPPPTPHPVREHVPGSGRVTSGFGERTDPIDGSRRRHHGVDIAAPAGSPIHSAKAGTVTFAGSRGGYGNVVIIDHGDGVETRYAHCLTLGVEIWQRVGAGEVVATVGSTGRSTGPHVHFEVRRGGVAIDPAEWIEVPQVIAPGIRGDDHADFRSGEGSP